MFNFTSMTTRIKSEISRPRPLTRARKEVLCELHYACTTPIHLHGSKLSCSAAFRFDDLSLQTELLRATANANVVKQATLSYNREQTDGMIIEAKQGSSAGGQQ